LINVNTAGAADLEALPGVGPVLAQRIFDYREEHGRFTTIEDLLDVPGIGEAKLATLREAAILR
jgi:competence protein ComEA